MTMSSKHRMHDRDSFRDADGHFSGFNIAQLAITSLSLSILTCTVAVMLIYFQIDSKTLLSVDYTMCMKVNSNVTCQSIVDRQMFFDKPIEESCTCRLEFDLHQNYQVSQINIYYGLGNFNQNYRFLAQSRDPYFLKDQTRLKRSKSFLRPAKSKSVALPYGDLANVMFDDEFKLFYENNRDSINLDRFNISLESLREYQYSNPSDAILLKNSSKPPRWHRHPWKLDEENPLNNGLENGPFIVWMTLSTFDDFIKLYAFVKPPGRTLKKGRYSLEIIYRFGVFGAGKGSKRIVIEMMNAHGMRNPRLLASLSCLSLLYFLLFIVVIFLVWRL